MKIKNLDNQYLLIILIIIIILLIILFYIDKSTKLRESFCYGNVFCYGPNALCINQRCIPCGLEKQCTRDSQCGANNCIDGCCDNA